jgi:hypothetical protein
MYLYDPIDARQNHVLFPRIRDGSNCQTPPKGSSLAERREMGVKISFEKISIERNTTVPALFVMGRHLSKFRQ